MPFSNSAESDEDEEKSYAARLLSPPAPASVKLTLLFRSADEHPSYNNDDSQQQLSGLHRDRLLKSSSSMAVFQEFLRIVPNANGEIDEENGRIDASQIVSKACFDRWLAAMKIPPSKPEKSFQRTLSAHLTGLDGRSPFNPREEAAILEVLRKPQRWPCFEKESVKFGLRGFRAKGYHEKKQMEYQLAHPQQQQVPAAALPAAVPMLMRRTESMPLLALNYAANALSSPGLIHEITPPTSNASLFPSAPFRPVIEPASSAAPLSSSSSSSHFPLFSSAFLAQQQQQHHHHHGIDGVRLFPLVSTAMPASAPPPPPPQQQPLFPRLVPAPMANVVPPGLSQKLDYTRKRLGAGSDNATNPAPFPSPAQKVVLINDQESRFLESARELLLGKNINQQPQQHDHQHLHNAWREIENLGRMHLLARGWNCAPSQATAELIIASYERSCYPGALLVAIDVLETDASLRVMSLSPCARAFLGPITRCELGLRSNILGDEESSWKLLTCLVDAFRQMDCETRNAVEIRLQSGSVSRLFSVYCRVHYTERVVVFRAVPVI